MSDERTIAALREAAETMHDIASGIYARRRLARETDKTALTTPKRASLTAKSLTDEQISRLALDGFEKIALLLGEIDAR